MDDVEIRNNAIAMIQKERFAVPPWRVIELCIEAARAALTGPDVTREDVLQAVARGWCAERNANKTMDVDLATAIAEEVLALRHFARAPGGKVPSVEEIEAEMRGDPRRRLGYSGPSMSDMQICARVAHAMMQRIDGGQRMMIEGMTEKQIFEEFAKEPLSSDQSFAKIYSRVAHRLATTPAPTEDPDRWAKGLAWIHAKASGFPHNATPDLEWDDYSEGARNGWRAVAKETGDE